MIRQNIKLLLASSCTFFVFCSNAQLGVQVNAGLMNYGGDLQTKRYTFSQSAGTAGVNLQYFFGNFGLRTGFVYGAVQADDAKTQQYIYRNLSFRTAIAEFSLCAEYDFSMLDKSDRIVPYIFAGAGVFHYNPYTTYNGAKVFLQPLGTEGEGLSIYPDRKLYALTNFENPVGLGVKYKLNDSWLIGIEFNTRFLYTDYLDDVSKTYPDENALYAARGQLAVDLSFRGNEINPNAALPPAGRVRGNPNQNDNYYSSVITLTYIFPTKSSFGVASGSSRKSARAVNCPRKVH